MKNKDGMRYPSVDKLLTKIDSKYKLAYLAARRAKLIAIEGDTLVPTMCKKNVGKALEEILDDKLDVEFKIAEDVEDNFR